MDQLSENIQKAYRESVLGERKFDLGSGHMGNGITVWNRAKEVHGDYEQIAHIDRNRKIKYYIKNPPKQVKDYVEKIAKGKNPNISATQSQKVFNEGYNELNEASEVEFNEFDSAKQKFIADLVGKANVKKQQYFSGIHGTIVSFHDPTGLPSMRVRKDKLKKILSNKDVRWVDITSIGLGYNKES